MVLELHVWGPAFELPSIDPECIATIAYFHRIVPRSQWALVADYDATVSSQGEFPVLVDGAVNICGFTSIVSYLRNHRSGAYDLDYHLTHKQQTDKIAYTSFLQSVAGPLVDLSLYISSENYSNVTASSYTEILPWFSNYSIPPTRRDLARNRTSHLGLGSLDLDVGGQDHSDNGIKNPASEYEAAKRAAGLPVDSGSGNKQPNMLNMGRGRGIKGLLGSPLQATRFKLDALTNDLFEPLSLVLGKKVYLFEGDKPSSLDCLAFGYLALMFYPQMPQSWLKDMIQTKFPRIVSYIGRMREELLGGEQVKPADVWSITTSTEDDNGVAIALENMGMRLPWRPRDFQTVLTKFTYTIREIAGNIPLLSSLVTRDVVVRYHQTEAIRRSIPSSLPSQATVNILLTCSVTLTALLAGLAVHHRLSPRDGPLIFQSLRSTSNFAAFGDASSILSVLVPREPFGRP